MARVLDLLAESFSSAWRLLSDTTNFLSRVGLLESHETDLRAWRDRLSRARNDARALAEVRAEVVALRRALREQGHDLRLGSRDAVLEGFRHDDALAEGFRRIALGAADEDVYWVAGDANHIELARQLEEMCGARRRCLPYTPHFLWYRWRNNVLVLSGSASETPEMFEAFRAYFATHKELLLRTLARA